MILLWLLCLHHCLIVIIEAKPIALTKYGQIRGKQVQVAATQFQMPLDVYQFTGIPYAEPPVGHLRFRRPQPIQPWNNTDHVHSLDATKAPKPCPQIAHGPRGPKEIGSEDCLYLNVWVPRAALDALVKIPKISQRPFPVFVFIHGGSFASGSTNEIAYNGSYLAAYNDIIVVTVQYRLGSLGFAYLGNDEVPGNMGLWDQVEALKWVHENIVEFGGNNMEITIGGQEAGAVSVTWHLLSTHSRPYFHRAIIQSGTALSPWGVNGPEVAVAATNTVFNHICNQTFAFLSTKMHCLRAKNAHNFAAADELPRNQMYEHVFLPVIDGVFIPRDPWRMLSKGDFYQVPILVGANKDEGTIFLARSKLGSSLLRPYERLDQALGNLTYLHYNKLISDRFKQIGGEMAVTTTVSPLIIEAITLHYWPQTHEGATPKGEEVFYAVADAFGDYGVSCPTFVWGNLTANTVRKVFMYFFSHRRFYGDDCSSSMRVANGDELLFIFGRPFFGSSNFTESERHLSVVMMAYWANFIKYGDPNDGVYKSASSMGVNQLRIWPPYTGRTCTEQYFELNVDTQVPPRSTSAVVCGLKRRDCMFWNEYIPKLATKFQTLEHPDEEVGDYRYTNHGHSNYLIITTAANYYCLYLIAALFNSFIFVMMMMMTVS